MNELRIQSLSFLPGLMEVRFSDGRQVVVPLDYFPRLRTAGPEELNRWSLIGRGLGAHWEDLDEDLSVENILTAYSRHHKADYAPALRP